MKLNKHVISRIITIAQDELSCARSISFFKMKAGYLLFGKYYINAANRDSVSVNKSKEFIKTFSKLQAAVAWCIADNIENRSLARKIYDLDLQFLSLSNDIFIRVSIAKRMSDPSRKQVILDKLLRKQHTLRGLEKQLNKYINIAKYWQIKGFKNNETARLR